MNLRMLLAIFLAVLFTLSYMVYFSQGHNPLEAVTPDTETNGAIAEKDDFVYKVDPRRFDQTPNNVAITEKWTDDKDVMVLIKPDNPRVRPYYIDAYEATISNYRAWSVPGQTPTDKLRPVDAQVACEAAGKRLCSQTEWQTACRGGSTKKKPYTIAAELMKICDFARSKGYDRTDYVNKTDSHPKCTPHGSYPLHHMLGNLSEFAEDDRGRVMILGLTYYDGKMRDKATRMRHGCERIVSGGGQYPPERFNKGLGFRCCKTAR